MADTLRVKYTSETTGEVTEGEIDLNSLTVFELQKKMKDIYALDLNQADAERLLRGEKVTLYKWQGMTFLSWGNG